MERGTDTWLSGRPSGVTSAALFPRGIGGGKRQKETSLVSTRHRPCCVLIADYH